MSWLIFTLLAINLWSISNIIDKNVVSKRVRNTIIPVIIVNFGSLFYAVISFLAFNAIFSFEGFFLGFLWTIILIIYFKAMQLEEASRVTALFSLIPIFVVVLAYLFLGEKFGLEKYTGIFLIVIGTALISIRRSAKITVSKAFYLMLVFALTYAIFSILLKYFLNYISFVSIFASMQTGIFIGGFILYLYYKKEIKNVKLKTIGLLLIAQFFGVTGLLSIIYAVSLGPISLITAIENTQQVFVLLYASILTIFKPHIIKEDISKGPLLTKIFAIAVMIIGAYLVSV